MRHAKSCQLQDVGRWARGQWKPESKRHKLEATSFDVGRARRLNWWCGRRKACFAVSALRTLPKEKRNSAAYMCVSFDACVCAEWAASQGGGEARATRTTRGAQNGGLRHCDWAIRSGNATSSARDREDLGLAPSWRVGQPVAVPFFQTWGQQTVSSARRQPKQLFAKSRSASGLGLGASCKRR